ncbi:Aste57867_20771 [Aphanomyces stellatus]|uniref:glucan endo-1,3-beta-D-glucosidase n=1 Tax=Aphanomyces stellatus TaxID=120398 RepID=A0A485LFR5_9STRA|nr:hypothetical protein As57867_020703 [Aphanomyces stellatus]VFT97450.1 Aste57867_20771 [Aphanomyces stellatus]
MRLNHQRGRTADNVVTTSTAIVVIAPDVEYIEPTLPPTPSRKRALMAVAAALLVVGAVVGALVSTGHTTANATNLAVGSGSGGASVCYDSWDSWGPGNMEAHFRRIKERFSGVRTYQTQGARNHIEVAADVGLSIYAGVWIKSGDVDGDMRAAVDGAKRFPDTVKAIFVGNEEIHDGKDQWFVIGRVNQMKQMLHDAGVWNVKVGSVQTDGDWLNKADELAKVCDVIGVNIHPFFGASDNSKWNPILDLQDRWNAMTNRFGDNVILTETGWPTNGAEQNGHQPSWDTAKRYVGEVGDWISNGHGGDAPAYFMFSDNPHKWSDVERSFGVADSGANWKFEFSMPGGNGNGGGDDGGSGGDAPPTDDETRGVVFVNTPNDQVLALAGDRAIEFHARWGNDWPSDASSKWTVRGHLIATWEAATQSDVCLDAYEPWNGGRVHVWACDAGNANQQWRYEARQIKHNSHAGFCLDMGDGAPQLWECVDDAPLQQFEWWK